jgi:hypothetical protein
VISFFQTEGHESPISKIFGGKMRSSLKYQGGKLSATVEPFQSLQLDIQVCFLHFSFNHFVSIHVNSEP